ncbi:MAG: hypothetical protein M3313_08670 [Actinomycetota bacterium]|nr:hypothetical protein [Actinomycetota bacterium]
MPEAPFTHLVTSEAEPRNDGYPQPPPRAWETPVEVVAAQLEQGFITHLL